MEQLKMLEKMKKSLSGLGVLAAAYLPPGFKEVLLQTAIYCGVPAANRAFAIAQQVLDEP